MRVYLAGPLFTAAERDWNMRLAQALARRGVEVFLPQRDCERDELFEEFSKKISVEFALYSACRGGVASCDVVLANYDGADGDAGTAWEAGYAAGRGLSVYWYRTDFRKAADTGQGVNLMLMFSGHKLDLGEMTPSTDLSPYDVAEAFVDMIHAREGQIVS